LGLVSHPLKAIGLMITSFLALQNGTDKHQSIASKASALRQNQKNHPVLVVSLMASAPTVICSELCINGKRHVKITF
jgi:hypothetical protein